MKKHNDFKILIAEDDPGARRLYEKTFAQEGYSVVLVEAGGQMMAELMARTHTTMTPATRSPRKNNTTHANGRIRSISN